MRHNSTDRAEKSMKSYKRMRWRLHGLETRGRQESIENQNGNAIAAVCRRAIWLMRVAI
ncbi:hypothetical protein BAAM1489_01460 [Bifidobacterium animalis subsp. animalis MCC 1489]|nr:hypothetical protein BANAN_03075 [Bifidobacterium animalis subsp. animalis ATCC 25527]KFI44417.1 hypothetical protein BASA_5000 [Bifidobacterium animalis subsp. animalis]KOA53759.1 hypothetical protein BAAA27672_08130 [Bifidobacterium animalis subsp. animalis ATCC 27672]KOA61063.1 hypothetical protein BAAM0499_04390 [Bifidobacterium animalis subsp. animalis MCC 0499]KOA64825.1 hypothetical protein BAAM1489_01460 [Bifidobacterium animalis subsp. animalis MCC 1489]